MIFKNFISKINNTGKKFGSFFARHFLKLVIGFVFLFLGLPMITLGYLPYMDDPRGMYFVGNLIQDKADLNGDGKEESMRIDAFNFWGGNSGQNILIVENDQSDLLGCWDLGEYRSHVNDLNSRSEVIYVDMTTHQTNDSMASPTKHVTYKFRYNYYDHVLVFNNEIDFHFEDSDFGDSGIRTKPSPCDWSFRFYLLKKEFNPFEFRSYLRLLNLLSAEVQEKRYYNFYKIKDGEE